jgi:hypothetical protein
MERFYVVYNPSDYRDSFAARELQEALELAQIEQGTYRIDTIRAKDACSARLFLGKSRHRYQEASL